MGRETAIKTRCAADAQAATQPALLSISAGSLAGADAFLTLPASGEVRPNPSREDVSQDRGATAAASAIIYFAHEAIDVEFLHRRDVIGATATDRLPRTAACRGKHFAGSTFWGGGRGGGGATSHHWKRRYGLKGALVGRRPGVGVGGVTRRQGGGASQRKVGCSRPHDAAPPLLPPRLLGFKGAGKDECGGPFGPTPVCRNSGRTSACASMPGEREASRRQLFEWSRAREGRTQRLGSRSSPEAPAVQIGAQPRTRVSSDTKGKSSSPRSMRWSAIFGKKLSLRSMRWSEMVCDPWSEMVCGSWKIS